MATARNIITKALQKIGAVTKNESPSADEAADGLDSLNALLNSWAIDSLSISNATTENLTLTPNVGQYTIGTGAALNTVRPNVILAASARDVSNLDYQLQLVSEEWFQNNIGDKTQLGLPTYISYSASWPNGIIRLWPVPDQAYTLVLTSEKPLTELATLDTVVNLPNGWERALIYNLAMEVAGEYGQQVPAEVVKIANDSLRLLQLNADRNRPFDVPPLMLNGRYNVYVGF